MSEELKTRTAWDLARLTLAKITEAPIDVAEREETLMLLGRSEADFAGDYQAALLIFLQHHLQLAHARIDHLSAQVETLLAARNTNP